MIVYFGVHMFLKVWSLFYIIYYGFGPKKKSCCKWPFCPQKNTMVAFGGDFKERWVKIIWILISFIIRTKFRVTCVRLSSLKLRFRTLSSPLFVVIWSSISASHIATSPSMLPPWSLTDSYMYFVHDKIQN